MKLIVGLGNPGKDYQATRHNAGFFVVEKLAQRHGLGKAKNKFHGNVTEGQIRGNRVMLIKPTTYMNRSGLAVGEAMNFFKLDPADVMIVVDDTALPTGSIRLRSKGSCGGHNGLEDIQRAIGTSQYPRLRIGIGEPVIDDMPIQQADYVLGRFTDEQLKELDPVFDKACDAIECWLTDGLDMAMTSHNTKITNGKNNVDQNEIQDTEEEKKLTSD